jgi:hypothetical protein
MKPGGIPNSTEEVKEEILDKVSVSEEKPVEEKKTGKNKPKEEKPVEPNVKLPIDETPPKEKTVKVQSDYRGVITTIYGDVDFGFDGLVEVPERIGKYLSRLKGYAIV